MLVPGNRDDGKKEQLTDSLMREVADGDRAAFEQLYRITQNSVYCYTFGHRQKPLDGGGSDAGYLSFRPQVDTTLYSSGKAPALGFLRLLEI